MAEQPAQAFLSYAHTDDELLEGCITWLREELQRGVRGRTGKPFKIFMDKVGINWGQHFPSKLDGALEEARFFIPILSPCYFASPYCRKEAEFFLNLETKADRRDLILPIYLIETDLLEDGTLCAGDELAVEMAQRQYADWRDFAFELGGSSDIKKRVFDLAKQIKLAMERAAEDAAPIIPEQMIGVRFWINFDGLIEQAKQTSRSPTSGHNELQVQRVAVLEACERAIGSFSDPSLHNTSQIVLGDLERYRTLINIPVGELDMNELWCRGVAIAQLVENAQRTLHRLKLPPLQGNQQAFLNAFIRLHTSFVLATPEGEAMQTKADRYPTSRITKTNVFELMARLSETVQNNDDLVTDRAKGLLETLCRRLDHKTQPEQHLLAVLSTCRNLLLAVGEAATGKDIHDIGDDATNKARDAATQFLLGNKELARDLASWSYDGLSWLNHLLDWLEWQRASTLPARPAQAAMQEIISNDFRMPGRVFRDINKSWCPEMVVIPAGRFMMGSSEDEPGRRDNEGPQHLVTITKPFALGRYPVTFDEFAFFCNDADREGPSSWGPGRWPVTRVSWDDAMAYCAWLSKWTSASYRLPSEAEWEYACRAGTKPAYAFGETIDEKQANFDGNAGNMTEVGAYPANAFKLHEMHGNIREWCADHYQDSYINMPMDGNPMLLSHGTDRVARGGSWHDVAQHARSAYRDRYDPNLRLDVLGFRCARVLE